MLSFACYGLLCVFLKYIWNRERRSINRLINSKITDEYMQLRMIVTDNGLPPDNFPPTIHAFLAQGVILLPLHHRFRLLEDRILTFVLAANETQTRLLRAYGHDTHGMNPRQVRTELAAFLGLHLGGQR